MFKNLSGRAKAIFIALALAIVGTLAFVLPAQAVVGPSTGLNEVAGQYTCTTNSSGACTVTHTLGATPAAVDITLANPAGGSSSLPYQLAVTARTSTDFTIRALTTTGGSYASSTLTFNAILVG
jgi:microcystin-dependent protein